MQTNTYEMTQDQASATLHDIREMQSDTFPDPPWFNVSDIGWFVTERKEFGLITFLPYADFDKTACCLDYKRLGKQRLEAIEILKAIIAGPSSPWANHPATRMWAENPLSLVAYTHSIIDEWRERGYKDTRREVLNGLCRANESVLSGTASPPFWLGDEAFHASHRAALLCKDYGWYSQWGWTEEPAKPNEKGSFPYVWPV